MSVPVRPLLVCAALVLLSMQTLPGADDPQPTGFLHASFSAARPLGGENGGELVTQLVNVCPVPVQVAIGPYDYLPFLLDARLPAKSSASTLDPAVWGPETAEAVPLDPSCIFTSGVTRPPHAPDWPAREGITLMKDEGYARILRLQRGWLDPAKVPRGANALVMDMTQALWIRMPRRAAGAVAPGRPVLFDEPTKVYAPGGRLVPYARIGDPPPAIAAAVADPGLGVVILLPAVVEAGKDVEATYLIGNQGGAPLWIEQNGLVPAHATWEVLSGSKAIATIDGSALSGMADLLPERAPLLLNPGEWLSWRRVLLASALPVKRGTAYRLGVRLDASIRRAAPEDGVPAQRQALSATIDLRPQ